jgi:Transcriptional regulator
MTTKVPDRRPARTVSALRTSLIELMLEKHYDSITVQDIIDRANVGRSTFYSHFRDKEDLLVGDWKRFYEMIAEYTNLSGDPSRSVAPIEGLTAHLKDMHALYRALERSGKTDRLFSVGIDHLADKLEEKIRSSINLDELSVPPAFCAYFLSLQIFGALKWWLDRNMPYSPRELAGFCTTLIDPGFTAAIGKPQPSA